jgi:hypothetical protein
MCHSCMSREVPLVGYTNISIVDAEGSEPTCRHQFFYYEKASCGMEETSRFVQYLSDGGELLNENTSCAYELSMHIN